MNLKDECVVLVLLHLVLDAAGLRVTMTSEKKLVNDSFMVVCTETNGLPVTWSGPKGPLGPKTRPYVDTLSYGIRLVFNGTRMEDSGTYTCSNTKENAKFHLTVWAPLVFSDTAINQTAKEGEEFIVKCEVKYGKVSWHVEGHEIEAGNNKYKVLGDGLLIKNVGPIDSRTYTCRGLQEATGNFLDRQIYLHVKHKPVHPVHQTKRVTQEVRWGYINGDVNLTCNVLANPPAKFEWQKNNDTRKKIGRVRNDAENLSILQLHIDESAFGDYKCIAKNEYGTYEKWFKLEKGVKPYPPENVNLESVTGKSLTLLITESEASQAIPLRTLGFSIRYKKNGHNWQYQEFNRTQENFYTLTDLEQYTEYEIEAATRNVAGLSDYSTLTRFKTSTATSVHHLTWLLYSILGALLSQAVW